MVHEKLSWKWHQCLHARDELIHYDSEYENDDYPETRLIMEDKQDSNGIRLNKQEQLKEEAKMAFVTTAKMARMQVQIERQELEMKRSSLYTFIGINRPFTRQTLETMNIGQLQVILNDLYCQIEGNNNQLINLLIERDSLSMEQDSILVDIEDFTQRLQERAISQSHSTPNYVYIIKRPEVTPPKRSIFQRLFSK